MRLGQMWWFWGSVRKEQSLIAVQLLCCICALRHTPTYQRMGCSNAPSSVPAKDLVVGEKIHHNLLGAIIQNHYYCVISLMVTNQFLRLESEWRFRLHPGNVTVTLRQSEDLVPVYEQRLVEFQGLFAWIYQQTYQLKFIVFFSHNKSALASFNTSRIHAAQRIHPNPGPWCEAANWATRAFLISGMRGQDVNGSQLRRYIKWHRWRHQNSRREASIGSEEHQDIRYTLHIPFLHSSWRN